MSTLKSNWVDGDQYTPAAANAVANTFPLSGTYAARPAAGYGGRVYYCTDNDSTYYDNGTSWSKIKIGADSCGAMGPVPTTGWTAVNMLTGCTWAQDKDDMLFTVAANGTGDNWMYQYRAYPTPPFTLTTYIEPSFKTNSIPASSKSAIFGIVVSDGTKLITLGLGWDSSAVNPYLASGFSVLAGKWSTVTSATAWYGGNGWPAAWSLGIPRWFRFSDDGTNITLQCSVNGIDWTTLGTESRTAFLTPSRIGVGGENYTSNDAVLRVRSWNGVS